MEALLMPYYENSGVFDGRQYLVVSLETLVRIKEEKKNPNTMEL